MPESVFGFVKRSLHQFCIGFRSRLYHNRPETIDTMITISMAYCLLRAPLSHLAHGQSYGAHDPTETTAIECSLIRAFCEARDRRDPTLECVSKSIRSAATAHTVPLAGARRCTLIVNRGCQSTSTPSHDYSVAVIIGCGVKERGGEGSLADVHTALPPLTLLGKQKASESARMP